MSPKLAVSLFTLLITFTTFAKDRAVSPSRQSSGASVTGEVASVSGTLITLAGGHVSIDATNARILDGHSATTIAAVKPGTLITATVQEPAIISTGPLVATTIAILRNADVTFIGTTQIVDVAGSQFFLLNRNIRVDTNTTFVNFGDHPSIAGLQANMHVLVEADVAGAALVASRITLIAPISPRPQTATGVVKSIGTEAWVITVREHDLTFVVNASTRILGSPRVGDKVEVVYTVDTAHANVALAIIKSAEPPRVVHFNGVVKSIENSRWVITRDDDHKDIVIIWPESVRISPAVSVGDHVAVVASENADGTYKLISIVKRRP